LTPFLEYLFSIENGLTSPSIPEAIPHSPKSSEVI
jgi:hypothetical protein